MRQFRLTIRLLMILVAIAALCFYIVAQGIAYQNRYLHHVWTPSR